MIADVVDVNQKFGGSSINVEWLLESLRENDKVFQKLHNQRPVKEITAYDVSEGKGFASQILRCTLTFVDSKNTSDVYTTILKIPGFESFIKANSECGGDEDFMKNELIEKFNDIHEFECNFYKHLAPILDAPVPKVYKTLELVPGKHDGCLHMEDLTLRGKTLSFFENINLTQVKCFIRHLAHMHKNILCADPKLWQGKYLKNQEAMAKVIDFITPMLEPFLKNSKQEDKLRPFIEKYGKFFESKDYYHYAMSQSYKDKGFNPVIVHGDMHGGNFMWAIDKNGDVQNNIAAFVDWQTIYEGSPMADLARFLVMCADGVVRRQAEEFAIDYYLECLTKEFNGDSIKLPYTAEKLKKEYKIMFLTQVYMLPCGVTFLLKAIEKQIPNQAIKDAYLDYGVLKALHGFEDAANLLDGEMKDFFEKYGV